VLGSFPSLSRLRVLAWCVISTLAVSGCEDAGDDPFAVAVAPETHGAVLFSHDLPTVPNLLSFHGLAPEAAMEAEAWQASWGMGEEEGSRLRSQIYPLAARRLLPLLGVAGVRDLLARNEVSLAAVEAMGSMVDLATVSSALAQANALQSQALSVVALGEEEKGLVLAFRTADALWTVTPPQVVAELMERAAHALGRNGGSGTYSEEELIRIRRLMYGASEALDDGDYPRAIRRAYYACQLLGATPP